MQPACRLAAVRSIAADASSQSQPLMVHLNQDGQAVATAGEGAAAQAPDVAEAPADRGTCDPKYWSCPGAAGYKIRGSTYLKVLGRLAPSLVHTLTPMCDTRCISQLLT